MSRIMLLLTLAITIAAHPLGSDLVAKSSGSDLVASFLEDGKEVSSDRLPWLKLLGETSSVDDDHARGKPAHRERISSAKKPGIDELESRMTADGKSQDKWGGGRRRRHSHSPHSHSPHSHSPHSHTPAPTNSWESSTVSAVADLTELQLAAWHATNAYNECSLSFTGHADGYSATASDCYDDTAQQSAELEADLQTKWGLVGDGIKAVKEAVVDPTIKVAQDAWDAASNWYHGIMEDTGVQRYVAANGGTVVVAFRGSEEGQDWLTNLQFTTTNWAFAGDSVPVHTGFYGQYSAQRAALKANLDARTITHIIVTGHSLGGGLAQLAAYDLAHLYSVPVSLYTFAAPRASPTSSSFQDNLKTAIDAHGGKEAHVTNEKDVVPCLPDAWDEQRNILHWSGSDWSTSSHCTNWVTDSYNYFLSIASDGGAGDHDLSQYCAAVGATCPTVSEENLALQVPKRPKYYKYNGKVLTLPQILQRLKPGDDKHSEPSR